MAPVVDLVQNLRQVQLLGHTTPEMLFTVYVRYIPNRTRRDGSAFASRMSEAALPEAQKALAVIPK